RSPNASPTDNPSSESSALPERCSIGFMGRETFRGANVFPQIMRASVVMFPGINADQEMIRTLELCGFETKVVWHTDTALAEKTDLVAIPGGFSYGDYLRCGALARTSPIC